MSLLNDLPHDDIYIVDLKTIKHGPFKARRKKDSFIIEGHDAKVEKGYTFIQKLPHKMEDISIIESVEYKKGIENTIPDKIIIKLSKASNSPQTATTYNFQNSSVQIGDNNTQNTVNISKLLNDELEKIEGSEEDKKEARNLLEKISESKLVNTIIGTLLKAATRT